MSALRLAIAAAVLVAGTAAQSGVPSTANPPTLLIGASTASPQAVPGVRGRLEVRPIVTRPYAPGAPVVTQIEAVRDTVPSLAGLPLSGQILFRDRAGELRLGPPVRFGAAPQGVQHAVARPVDERGAPPDPDAERLEQAPSDQGFDPSEYRPLPVPRAPEGHERADVEAGEPVTFDLRAQRVVRTAGPARRLLDSLGDHVPGSGGEVTGEHESDLMLDNFNKLRLVNSYASFPWRMNVKIFNTYPNGAKRVCSGVLIDPMHVLTAGHCVHNKSRGGWVKSLRVVPAYNGSKSGDGREPYGSAKAVQLHSWTGWTKSQQFKHDIAVVDLDRPVGAITGWFGYGFDNSCSWFTSPTWHHASYPAESPFNGRRMYYQWGDFDSCPGLIPPLNRFEARFKRRSYGGESGSGHYKFKSGSRIAYAVLSHGTSSRTDAVRLTSGKFNNVKSFLAADRPSKFDFTPLDVGGSSKVARGSRIAALDFLLHNYSKASFKGKIAFNVRLSTNTFISTADRNLGNFTVSFSTGSLGNTRVRWKSGQGPRVPSNVSVRDYYVGIILTTKDAKSSNQRTGADDVHKIRVFHRGGFSSFGRGCVGTKGRVRHTVSGTAKVGRLVSYRLSNAPGGTSAWLALGTSRTRFGSLRLPFDLRAIGAPSCFAYINHVRVLRTRVSRAGTAARSFRLPTSSSAVGANVLTQYLVLDGRANQLGLTTTNAIDTEIGKD